MFDNTYLALPERFYARVKPSFASDPQLLALNQELAEELSLEGLLGDNQQSAEFFSGNQLLQGAEPIALAYAGHQFGQFVPQLGDGRAALLGEVIGRDQRRYDIQLKGSGHTPFSRNGDGKSALGPVIREYLLSEAMHRLGVPTTRALAAVQTGDIVQREKLFPGGVFTRVAASHIRVGTFEFFAARSDKQALRALASYAIQRHYPDVSSDDYLAFFDGVAENQAVLIAHWMDVGFIHGVMNTDNTSIAGETLDYGPCAFMDEFRFDKVFSSIDHGKRYAYGNQARIAQWNLARLAECLLLLDDDQAAFEAVLEQFPVRFDDLYRTRMAAKLGFSTHEEEDGQLIKEWLEHLQKNALDYTLSFRRLANCIDSKTASEFGEFGARWKQRLARQPDDVESVRSRMNTVNPLFIARNHQVEHAIQGAIEGDLTVFRELDLVLKNPFDDQPTYSQYAEPPTPSERVSQTFCGT
ncbi:MAG: YdiU family protein [Gammaproteobacteria bacterium]